jgi:hypothetical protein
MTDVESRAPAGAAAPGRTSVDNPYRHSTGSEFNPIGYLKSFVLIGFGIMGLQHFKVYKTIFRSPNIDHTWFKIGLALSVGKAISRLLPLPASKNILRLIDPFSCFGSHFRNESIH